MFPWVATNPVWHGCLFSSYGESPVMVRQKLETELAKLVEHLDKASTAYGMEISAEKTKLMTNNTSGINRDLSK